MTWSKFWFGAKNLPFWVFSLRALILYISLIIGTRYMRQRQIAILSGHNYLVAAGIVSLSAVRMVNPESSLVSGIAIIFVYASINVFISYLDVKFPRQIDRHSTILVENGKLIRKNLMDSRITIDQLLGQLRIKNIFDLSEVLLALVEPTGKINVIKKSQSLPVTRKQMDLPLKNINLPIILVYDGEVQKDNLDLLGYNLKWLEEQISKNGFTDVKEIFLAMLESNGTIYLSA
ncbi:YetF domain-containing protein [Wukongibacter sp. M2B1]|uniref:YetF domain-containing protein n=1 Tax=Wukongibacter sp. M2B1 TaxID=3088895 RepID=UPI003D7B4DA0